MRIGTDILEIQRIADVLERKPEFPQRILTERELALYQSYSSPKRQVSFLAGRFAAKEAYGKAVGTGVGTQLRFKDISIIPDIHGVPMVVSGPFVYPEAKLSISHSDAYATATALIELDDATIDEYKKQYFSKEV